MKLIVGLGNPGKKYENTRHNVGFKVVEEIITNAKYKMKNEKLFCQGQNFAKRNKFKIDKKFQAEVCSLNKNTLLVKPQTFMNNSGKTIKLLISNFQIPTSNIWVIHDDLDLDLGRIKIQKGGQAAGHHGIESVIQELGSSDFVRFRLGIGRPGNSKSVTQLFSNTINNKTTDYVLDTFNKEEEKIIEPGIKRMAEAVLFALKEGIEKTMNKFN